MQNFSERQILWSLYSVDFHTFTLQLPIQTLHSVAPELQVFVSSLENCPNFGKISTPQMWTCLRFVAMMMTRCPGVCEFKIFNLVLFWITQVIFVGLLIPGVSLCPPGISKLRCTRAYQLNVLTFAACHETLRLICEDPFSGCGSGCDFFCHSNWITL